MRTFDLTPLFRSTVGFDRLSRAMDSAMQLSENAASYPPYNIERTGEDSYRISMAVAGFKSGDIEIVSHESSLTIRGKAKGDDEKKAYLYRGIAERAFERRFHLADYVKVTGASLTDGMLHIELAREVPEALKPRRIEIGHGPGEPQKLAAAA